MPICSPNVGYSVVFMVMASPVAAPKQHLDWFEDTLASSYELSRGGRAKEATVLNRVVRWTSEGLEYDADPRQGETLLEERCLDDGTNKSSTPGVKIVAADLNQDSSIDIGSFTKFRGHAARANYLAADRPDIQFSAKEICRDMAAPTGLSQKALKRLGRFML